MLERYEETGDVFRYLREATNATTFYTRLVMLVSALEAMAGELRNNGFRHVDRQYIANEILRDEELCERLFGGGRSPERTRLWPNSLITAALKVAPDTWTLLLQRL